MAEEIVYYLNKPDCEDQETYYLQARQPVTLQVIHSETRPHISWEPLIVDQAERNLTSSRHIVW